MISSHLPSFPRQSFADKLRPAQNPWFASCGTSIHTSQSMQTMQTWDSTWTPTMCEVLDFVRLVSVLCAKTSFFALWIPVQVIYKKHHHFVTKNFMAWDLIDTSSFSSSFHHRRSEMIWDLRWADPKSWKTSVKSAMEMLLPGLSAARLSSAKLLRWSFRFVLSGDVTLRDGKRFRSHSLESG